MKAIISLTLVESLWGSLTVRGCSTLICFTYLLKTHVTLFLFPPFQAVASRMEYDLITKAINKSVIILNKG